MSRSSRGIARLLFTHGVRRLMHERSRAALLLAAVALGVAVLVAVLYASDASVRSFQSSIVGLSGEDSVEIRARGGLFQVSDLDPLYGELLHHFEVIPFWEGRGKVGDRSVSVIAIDPFSFEHFNSKSEGGSEERWWGTPTTLAALGLKEGELGSVEIAGAVVALPIAASPSERRRGVVGEVLVTTLTALPKSSGVHAIKLYPRGEAPLADFAALEVTLRGLHSRFFLSNPQQRSEQAERLFEAFRLNIGVLVVMTMLVCAFVVFGASQLTVSALHRELAVLRTLGFSRPQLGAVVIAEATILGGLGTLVGLTLGRPLTEWCATLFLQSVAALYSGGKPPADLWGRPLFEILPLALMGGVGLCLLGAAVPSLRAAQTPPGLVSRAGIQAVPHGFGRYLVGALAALALAVLGSLLAPRFNSPALAHLAAFGTVGVLVGAAWPLLDRLARAARPVLAARLGVAGLLGAANVTAGVRVVGVAVATSAVGLSLLIGLGVMVSSFRATLSDWIGYTIRADLFVRPIAVGSMDRPERLPEDFESIVARLSGVSSIVRFASFEHSSPLGSMTVGGHDFTLPAHGRVFRCIAGVLDPLVLASTDSVIVSEAAARKLQVGVGGTVSIGAVRARVVAIYKDYSSEHGVILFELERFRRLFGVTALTSAAIHVERPELIDGVRRGLLDSSVGGEITVQRNDELRATILSIFDQTFQITDLMRFIVVIICALGFILTVMQLHTERRRDIQTLKTLGLSRRGLRYGVFVEGVLLVAPAVALGLLGGTALALILICLVNPLSFGWTLDFRPTVAGYVGPVAVVLISTVCAAAVVAIRPEVGVSEKGSEDE